MEHWAFLFLLCRCFFSSMGRSVQRGGLEEAGRKAGWKLESIKPGRIGTFVFSAA
jgi:hypothetical protein